MPRGTDSGLYPAFVGLTVQVMMYIHGVFLLLFYHCVASRPRPAACLEPSLPCGDEGPLAKGGEGHAEQPVVMPMGWHTW